MSTRWKAYFFDAGGTLFRMGTPMGVTIFSMVRGCGLACSPEDVQSAFEASFRKHGGLGHLRHCFTEAADREWWQSMTMAVFDQIGLDGGQRLEHFERLYAYYCSGEPWKLFGDALQTLTGIRARGARIGIVSNWSAALERICSELGIRQHVDFVLPSALAGAAKPDPRIFTEALRLAGTSPEDAVHIGDSPEEDVAGATAAGISALLLKRVSTAQTRGGGPPVKTIQRLTEMLEG